MVAHRFKQSNRIIIVHPGLTERYIKRSIYNRINYGEDIEEGWLRESNVNLTQLYKKRTANQWLAPAINESVVISHGIVIAKVITFLLITTIWTNYFISKRENRFVRLIIGLLVGLFAFNP